jgi:hypothetical protein
MSEHRIYRFPEWLETPYKHVIRKIDFENFKSEKSPPTEHDSRLDESLSRSRRLIQEYILCNKFSLFCTFTFDRNKVTDRKDYKAIKSKLSKFFNNFRSRYDSSFQYLIVPELHKDGSVHFHGVITAPVGLCTPLMIPKRDNNGKRFLVPNTPHYMDWPHYSQRFGYFSCSWIRNYTGCAFYVSKYMTKDLAQWFSRNDQIVMHSKGLYRPELVYCAPGYAIPGEKSAKDYDGQYCTVGMRDAWDTSELYFNADDYWEHYQDRVEDLPYVERSIFGGERVLMDWATYGELFFFPVDEWEQVSFRALENGS